MYEFMHELCCLFAYIPAKTQTLLMLMLMNIGWAGGTVSTHTYINRRYNLFHMLHSHRWWNMSMNVSLHSNKCEHVLCSSFFIMERYSFVIVCSRDVANCYFVGWVASKTITEVDLIIHINQIQNISFELRALLSAIVIVVAKKFTSWCFAFITNLNADEWNSIILLF